MPSSTKTVISTASVPTPKASRYLQQLCKHWSHNMAVEFTPKQGKVVFPKDIRGATWPDDAVFTMVAQDETLNCKIEATGPEHLSRLKGAVVKHLDRFAFREAPLSFNWVDQ